MYEDVEIETSYRYLKIVFSRLKEPIFILGGWAVFFTVNADYKRKAKRDYIGSRDIDLGFEKPGTLKETAAVLEKELKFDFVSFRFYKNVHSETGKDLTENESKSLPQHMIFPMYVDLIMAHADKKMKTKLGFMPIDEPLLKKAFGSKKFRRTATEFGKRLLLPSPEILLAMKLNSVLNRDKLHKRLKDVCDIVALCLFSGIETDKIIKESRKFVSKKSFKKLKKAGFENEVSHCSNTLGLEPETVKSVLGKING